MVYHHAVVGWAGRCHPKSRGAVGHACIVIFYIQAVHARLVLFQFDHQFIFAFKPHLAFDAILFETPCTVVTSNP